MDLNTLEDVFREQIADIYSAERQLLEALPKVANAATDPKLRQALEEHLEQTRAHVERLDQIMGQVGQKVPTETCEGMKGLLSEGEKVIGMSGEAAAKDAALIAAAQRVEHYEIAAYGTARTLADQLDFPEAKDLLDRTLHEEADADKRLTSLATGGMFGRGINEEASTSRL